MLLTRQTTLAGVIRKTTSSLSLTSLPSHLHSLSLSLTPSLTGRRIFLRIRNHHRRILLCFFIRIGLIPRLSDRVLDQNVGLNSETSRIWKVFIRRGKLVRRELGE
ncbi:hypothetical protein GLYMA_01G183550v4 [Glycine max]|nr:hypothetical protein GLYMA_01G183550v4 [Glycine max]KAH1163732.1 hypothetical protein GYH30_001992 [Glycine max]